MDPQVLDLVFHMGVLNPCRTPHVALVNRASLNTVTKHLRSRPFESIQKLVDDYGDFMDSLASFECALQHGYVPYQLSLRSVIKHRGHPDVLRRLLQRNVRITAGALVDAAMCKDPVYLAILLEAADPQVLEEARAWISEERLCVLHELPVPTRPPSPRSVCYFNFDD